MTPAVPSVQRRGCGDSEIATLVVGELRAEVLSYGAHLVGLSVPDRSRLRDEVVVSLRRDDGSVDVDAYRDPALNPHLGGTVGRYANRIAGARFDLGGVTHQLVANEGPNQLHGGPAGFDRREWELATGTDELGAEARLRLLSEDGDQGYPGAVQVEVIYRLEPAASLRIEVVATCDAPTPLSITNHSYWNLAGTSSPAARAVGSIEDHLLSVAAESVVQVDDALIPTGALGVVAGTPFDLRAPVRLGSVVGLAELASTRGLDHCYVLDGGGVGEATAPAALLADPSSGRRLRLWTDQPGLQVYTANHGAGPLPAHGAVCLESQHLPDAPNQPSFPPTVLRPGATYRHRQLLRFDALG